MLDEFMRTKNVPREVRLFSQRLMPLLVVLLREGRRHCLSLRFCCHSDEGWCRLRADAGNDRRPAFELLREEERAGREETRDLPEVQELLFCLIDRRGLIAALGSFSVLQEAAIIACLPPKHQRDLVMSIYKPYLKDCPLMQGLDRSPPPLPPSNYPPSLVRPTTRTVHIIVLFHIRLCPHAAACRALLHIL